LKEGGAITLPPPLVSPAHSGLPARAEHFSGAAAVFRLRGPLSTLKVNIPDSSNPVYRERSSTFAGPQFGRTAARHGRAGHLLVRAARFETTPFVDAAATVPGIRERSTWRHLPGSAGFVRSAVLWGGR